MSDIKVPEEMLEAGEQALHGKAWPGTDEEGRRNTVMFTAVEAQDIGAAVLKAALRWLSENPIVPTDEQWKAINHERQWPDNAYRRRWLVVEWQRRMFLAPEPEPALKDLLWKANPYPNTGAEYRHDETVKEAYRRGLKAGAK